MKKSLCIISEYNKDYSIINLLQNSSEYSLETILLTNTANMPTFDINGVSIVNNTHLECLESVDAIYISHNCFENAQKYLEIAIREGKLVDSIREDNSTLLPINRYYDINVPIFVVMGASADCGKNKVIVDLIRSLNQKQEKVAVISNYENYDLFGYYKFPLQEVYNCKTFNDKIYIINSFLYKVIQESSCSSILLSIPGGVCNPFFYYDCESTILAYLISKACFIDYLIYILPGNLWNEKFLKTTEENISNLLSKHIDYWILSQEIFDSTLFDNATTTNNIPKVSLLKSTVDKIYSVWNTENSATINASTLGADILADISAKLSQQIDCYKIL